MIMREREYVFGANIIENLTTGMYQDSRIIYREYIQNACDQIDKAIEADLVKPKEAIVQIWIQPEKKSIIIEDNATGIPAGQFESTLGDIANSSKKIGQDKGFRGIGKLAGLAYCKKIIFTSSIKGEKVISKLECDAALMRRLLSEHLQGRRYTAAEILRRIYLFSTEKTNDVNSHFFKVEMIDVNDENNDLLAVDDIRDYLSFVAPVPYSEKFYIKEKIYNYAKEHHHKIDEYIIKINGEQVFKEYELNYRTRSGEDSIRDLAFHEFGDNKGKSLGWMWLGVSGFKGAIPEACKMRCLRIRKENIQIGDENALQRFFTEERGVRYFIGEIFVTAPDLIPNSQRDYFNENKTRVLFEQAMRDYVNGELHKIFHKGSEMNTHLGNIKRLDKEIEDFEEKKRTNGFLNLEHEEKCKHQIEATRAKAEDAKRFFQRVEEKKEDGIAEKIIAEVAHKRIDEYNEEKAKNNNDDKTKKHIPVQKQQKHKEKNKPVRRTDRFSSYSSKERKLIDKIYTAIYKAVDESTAERIYEAIEEDLL